MFLRGKSSGFTIIEILITLVLLGLIASVVAPGLDAWLTSRNKATIRNALSSQLALMPLQASRRSSEIIISDASQLDIEGSNVTVIRPILILKNGYCKGGELALDFGLSTERFLVTSPYCEVMRISE